MTEPQKPHGLLNAETPAGHRWTRDEVQDHLPPDSYTETCTCGLRRRVSSRPTPPHMRRPLR